MDSLKRLEYRGYDSAGVATLEGDHLARRRAEGKLKNLEKRLEAEPLDGPHRHRAHPLGHPRQADREQRASARDRARRRGPQRHHREFSRVARGAREEGRRSSRPKPIPRSCCIWSTICSAGHQAGRGGEGGAVAAARRVRARVHLRRRRRSDDRRPQRPAARDRPWRRRNVSGLGRDRARAVHRHHQLSRRRRLGGADAQGRDHLRQEQRDRSSRGDQAHRPRPRWSTRRTTATSWPRKSTSSRKWSATRWRAMSTWRPSASTLPVKLPFDFKDIQRISITACGTASYAGYVAKYWFERLARVPVEVDVASEFRYREAPLRKGDLAIFISQSGETADTLAALRYAKARGRAHAVRGQRADLDDRARKRDRAADAGRSRNRRRLDQGVHLPVDGAGRARGRRRQGARRIVR